MPCLKTVFKCMCNYEMWCTDGEVPRLLCNRPSLCGGRCQLTGCENQADHNDVSLCQLIQPLTEHRTGGVGMIMQFALPPGATVAPEQTGFWEPTQATFTDADGNTYLWSSRSHR